MCLTTIRIITRADVVYIMTLLVIPVWQTPIWHREAVLMKLSRRVSDWLTNSNISHSMNKFSEIWFFKRVGIKSRLWLSQSNLNVLVLELQYLFKYISILIFLTFSIYKTIFFSGGWKRWLSGVIDLVSLLLS